MARRPLPGFAALGTLSCAGRRIRGQDAVEPCLGGLGLPADTFADIRAGLSGLERGHLNFANLGTRSVVGARAAVADLLGVALWHELGCDADADTRLRRRLQIA